MVKIQFVILMICLWNALEAISQNPACPFAEPHDSTIPFGQWFHYKGNGFSGQYAFSKAKYNWYEAESYCHNIGGHLIVCDNQNECDFAFDCGPHGPAWVNGNDRSGKFKWLNDRHYSGLSLRNEIRSIDLQGRCGKRCLYVATGNDYVGTNVAGTPDRIKATECSSKVILASSNSSRTIHAGYAVCEKP